MPKRELPNSDAERAYGLIRENLVRYQFPLTPASTGIPPYRQVAVAFHPGDVREMRRTYVSGAGVL